MDRQGCCPTSPHFSEELNPNHEVYVGVLLCPSNCVLRNRANAAGHAAGSAGQTRPANGARVQTVDARRGARASEAGGRRRRGADHRNGDVHARKIRSDHARAAPGVPATSGADDQETVRSTIRNDAEPGAFRGERKTRPDATGERSTGVPALAVPGATRLPADFAEE